MMITFLYLFLIKFSLGACRYMATDLERLCLDCVKRSAEVFGSRNVLNNTSLTFQRNFIFNMPIIFYTTDGPSPTARAVDTIIKIIKLDVEYRNVSIAAKEHLEPWYTKINPANQVPALDDNGFILTDSHAIIAYLLTVYAPKDILEQYYPTDPKQRALVDSSWHFENGMLFAKLKAGVLPLFGDVAPEVVLKNTEIMIQSFDIFERLLEGKNWVAGDKMTAADISSLTTIELAQASYIGNPDIIMVSLKHYKNISAWVERARKSIPFFKEMTDETIAFYAEALKNKVQYDAEELWDIIHKNAKK